jgi:hypothetical protein
MGNLILADEGMMARKWSRRMGLEGSTLLVVGNGLRMLMMKE